MHNAFSNFQDRMIEVDYFIMPKSSDGKHGMIEDADC
jgi:hypothetical protein